MQTMTAEQLADLDGRGFFAGVVCGASVALAIGSFFEPSQLGKLLFRGSVALAIGACGEALL